MKAKRAKRLGFNTLNVFSRPWRKRKKKAVRERRRGKDYVDE
jgi:hypothetical protein